MPEIILQAQRERVCATCRHYGFKPGNPAGWRYACCLKRGFWYPDGEKMSGMRKGCEDWE